MVTPERLAILTKLAVYDKRYGNHDRKINEFYMADYVYRQNFWTRLCALAAAALLILCTWLRRIFINGEDILTLNYQREALDALYILAIVGVVYTVVGSALAIREYTRAQRRLVYYNSLLEKLNQMDGVDNEEDTAEKIELSATAPRRARYL